MEQHRIQRRVDELGRIVLPIEIRTGLELDEKSTIDIWAEPEQHRIIMQKSISHCIYCGEENGLKIFRGKAICSSCQKEIATL